MPDLDPGLLPQILQFGPFEFRPDTGELSKSGGDSARLPPQPSRVLSLLIRRAPEIVTREELQAAIWGDGTVVEFDQGLNFCIRQIRAALGEDARAPEFIETIPKRGYRFVAPVTPVWPEGEPPVGTAPSRPFVQRAPIFVMAAALLFAGNVWWRNLPRTPGTPEADKLFKEAEHLADADIQENRPKAAERYKRVTELVPKFAPAWAGWSNIEIMMSQSGKLDGDALRRNSELHARKAVDLDDSLAIAHANLAQSYWHQWKWDEAEEEFKKADRLDSDDPNVQQLYGLFLASRGRKAEAIRRAKRAVELAPTSGVVNHSLAKVYDVTGEWNAAIAQEEKTLEMSHHSPQAYFSRMQANMALGRFDQAMTELEKALAVGGNDVGRLYRANILAATGHTTEARAIVGAFQKSPSGRRAPGQLISALARLGDVDAAFAALNMAVDDHVPGMLWIKSTKHPSIVSDPRFQKVLERMGNP